MSDYIVVIGLGSFGYYVVRELSEKNYDVIAIDKNSQKIETVKNFATKSIIADCTDKETLINFRVNEAKAVIVAAGPNMEDSILIVHFLKELGVKNIIAKAQSDAHGRILELIGATEVIFPERDSAIRVATRLTKKNLLDYLPLGEDYSIREIAPPEIFIGKTLKELDLRNKYSINIIAIKEIIPEQKVVIPTADFVIKESDILVVIGTEDALDKISKLK